MMTLGSFKKLCQSTIWLDLFWRIRYFGRLWRSIDLDAEYTVRGATSVSFIVHHMNNRTTKEARATYSTFSGATLSIILMSILRNLLSIINRRTLDRNSAMPFSFVDSLFFLFTIEATSSIVEVTLVRNR